jgi:type I restriction enzyme, R subunit
MGFGEADTRAKLIDPALYKRGWTENHLKREETPGSIAILNGKAFQENRGRVDYTLRVLVGEEQQAIAVAIIEAKRENASPAEGLEQVKRYAKGLNVPFVYSSNGHQFIEFDYSTGLTSPPTPIARFPTPEELRRRYEEYIGFRLDNPVASPLLVPYRSGEARYYQDAAIRATLEKIARCEVEGVPKRALLSLATGAGKTFIACNLLRKIADAGQLTRALFLCDRDELRTQAEGALQRVFGSDARTVRSGESQKNARVLIATYQTLGIDTDEDNASFLTTHYPENYFSHIIIDECHRSAWGKWSIALTHNDRSVQIGLTATPRTLLGTEEDSRITADNIAYFGEPVYEYDIGQGIEDGYLAACEIVRSNVDIDNMGISIEEVIARNPRDAKTGLPVSDADIRELYECTTFERRIVLPDRVLAMCADLFAYFVNTGGPEQKTVIFCASDDHADWVAIEMNNLYARWCADNGVARAADYAFKCTSKSSGNDYLADLRGSSRSHFIATTVDLLTTGVDVPALANIVFFRYVNSSIAFYQMVGRGTRLNVATGKLMFRVYDYTNATRLFGEAFLTKISPQREPTGERAERREERTILVEGFEVTVTAAGRSILTMVDGQSRPIPVEEYRERLAEKLIAEVRNMGRFCEIWVNPSDRRDLFNVLPDGGRSPSIIRTLDGLEDCDLFDILAELGYGIHRLTKRQRAEAFGSKQVQWLESLPPATSATVRAIANQFVKSGTEGLENKLIFRTPEVTNVGGLDALKAIGKPIDVVMDIKVRLFSA